MSIFGEMRSLALAYKVAGLDPTVVPAVRALRTAGAGGAEALGWGGLSSASSRRACGPTWLSWM